MTQLRDLPQQLDDDADAIERGTTGASSRSEVVSRVREAAAELRSLKAVQDAREQEMVAYDKDHADDMAALKAVLAAPKRAK